jgi:hypothetical protein
MKDQRAIPGSVVTGAAAGPAILGANGGRDSIIFSLTGAQPVLVWPASNNPANTGLQLVATDPILELCSCDFDPLIKGEWYAWSPGGASSLSWVEIVNNSPKGG